METEDRMEHIFEDMKEYVQTRTELLKHETNERIVYLSPIIIALILKISIALCVVFFFSFGLANYLSARISNPYSGYYIVAGIYLFILFILSIAYKRLVENPIRTMLIRKIYKSK